MNDQSVRPTKKQRELLSYIEQFITEHGYSPSYREIMHGLDYTSVATVALHVNNLIRRGHLRKRDRSARSLEVVAETEAAQSSKSSAHLSEENWLVGRVEEFFQKHEQAAELPMTAIEELHVLVNSLKLLGLEAAVQSFVPRLSELRNKVT